jgi:hypothetical protein
VGSRQGANLQPTQQLDDDSMASQEYADRIFSAGGETQGRFWREALHDPWLEVLLHVESGTYLPTYLPACLPAVSELSVRCRNFRLLWCWLIENIECRTGAVLQIEGIEHALASMPSLFCPPAGTHSHESTLSLSSLLKLLQRLQSAVETREQSGGTRPSSRSHLQMTLRQSVVVWPTNVAATVALLTQVAAR